MSNQVYYVTTQEDLMKNPNGSYVEDYATKQFDGSIKIFIDYSDLQLWYEYPKHFWIKQNHDYLAPNIPINETKQEIDKLTATNKSLKKQLDLAESSIGYLQRQVTLNNLKNN